MSKLNIQPLQAETSLYGHISSVCTDSLQNCLLQRIFPVASKDAAQACTVMRSNQEAEQVLQQALDVTQSLYDLEVNYVADMEN